MEIKDIVDNEEVAKRLAEVYISNIYGIEAANRQKPYDAKLIDDHWTIKGNLPKNLLGGVFEISIAKSDGRVLNLTHSR